MSAAPDVATVVSEPSQRELRRNIWNMVWPVAAENVLHFLIGFVNTAMVGGLSGHDLAGPRASRYVCVIIFNAIGTGTTVPLPRLSEQASRRARRVAQQDFSWRFH